MSLSDAPQRVLPPCAARVDAALVELDQTIDWLVHLSPLDNDAMWERFQASDYQQEPTLRYRAPSFDCDRLRQELLALPVVDVEIPLIQALLREKQRELDLQIELIRMCDTDGFMAASIDLFGGTDPALLHTAQVILDTVEHDDQPQPEVGCEHIVAAAEQELAYYRQQAPDLACTVHVHDDLNSLMMVNQGDFYVARSATVPAARVAPLMAHEIGTHVVTRHNGRKQVLRQLEAGLAHYDALQEGLGTFAEYLAGYLPPRRLRIIAARVIAADMAVHRHPVVEIFDRLHRVEGIVADDAFDVAVRARRGGGLTKDAVYLRGLDELLVYLADGGDPIPLYLGKFPLRHRATLEELVEQGWVRLPQIIPRHLRSEGGRARLARACGLEVQALFQRKPEP